MDEDKRRCLLCGPTYCDSKQVADYLRRRTLSLFGLCLQCRKQYAGGWLASLSSRKRPKKRRKATSAIRTSPRNLSKGCGHGVTPTPCPLAENARHVPGAP
jgi:hypothetical protein